MTSIANSPDPLFLFGGPKYGYPVPILIFLAVSAVQMPLAVNRLIYPGVHPESGFRPLGRPQMIA